MERGGRERPRSAHPARVRRAARVGTPPVGGRASESSLDTTELVHEAYLRLVDARHVDLPHRANFLALASQVMRNLLVDRARARLGAKRGGGVRPSGLDDDELVAEENLETITDLDDALKRLATLKPRHEQLLQHRYFGGRGIDWFKPEDIAEIKVLKYPHELAVYGPSGVNGVIVITTKQAAGRKR